MSPKLHPPPDLFHFLDFFHPKICHPPIFFHRFSLCKQNLARPTQFFTVILAQTGQIFGGMSAVDVQLVFKITFTKLLPTFLDVPLPNLVLASDLVLFQQKSAKFDANKFNY